MSGFTVTPEEMRVAANKFSQESQNINQTLQSIKGQIENLRSTWKGSAANNFEALMAQWTTDANSIHDVLDQVIQHLNQAATEYETANQNVGQGFQFR
jgi:WXG100 family type VII secretion target